MIRRAASFILFVLGGWVLLAEPVMGFMDFGRDTEWEQAFALVLVLVIAAVPLAIATVLSPGERWRKLGIAILIGTGFGVFTVISIVAIFNDPGFRPFIPLLPAVPKFDTAPVVGTVNVAVLAGVGWWLYRRSGNAAGDEGSNAAEGSTE